MDLNALTERTIGAAIEVHRALGPGLLESAYLACLAYELGERGLFIERQKPLPLIYKGISVEPCYRLDLVVERRVIVELKCVEQFEPVHHAQILTYMKLTGCPIGLLINFKVPLLKHGIKRFRI